jgi:glycerol-3-phosphate acyltransferase PlsY
MPILIVVVCALAGYLVGSIPFGYLIVRAVKGVDLRTVGSGRTGGTNAYRAAGLPAGFATAFLDTVKGIVCVLIIRALGLGEATGGWAEALAGVGVVLGHNASIFLNFAGGAGGATAVGTSLVYLPAAGLAALGVGVFFLVIVGYPFMASILAALAAAVGLTLAAVSGAVPASYPAFGWGIVAIIWATFISGPLRPPSACASAAAFEAFLPSRPSRRAPAMRAATPPTLAPTRA